MRAGFTSAAGDVPAHRLDAVVTSAAGESFDLFFSCNELPLRPSGSALAVAGLIPAMRRGETLEVSTPVSPRLVESVDAIVELLCAFHPDLHPVALSAPLESCVARVYPSRTAAFFTGGVDSFYTLLKHREEIGTLVYVHGFDVALDNMELRAKVSGSLREAAGRFGKRFVEVETNLRAWLDLHAAWGPVTHGAALAAVAHVLDPHIDLMYLAASDSIHQLFPWGSHPVLDPMWGSDRLRLRHDGCEAVRFQKLERIAGSAEALASLRVCWKNFDNAYNCGRCEKCLRTMIMLDAVGALDRCPVFSAPLTREAMEAIDYTRFYSRIYYYEFLHELRKNGRRPDLQRYLVRKLAPYLEVDPPINTDILRAAGVKRRWWRRLGSAPS